MRKPGEACLKEYARGEAFFSKAAERQETPQVGHFSQSLTGTLKKKRRKTWGDLARPRWPHA